MLFHRLQTLNLSLLSAVTSVSACTIQGECVRGDSALQWLSIMLSESAAISCKGSPMQAYNKGRYWGEQYGKNATVAVYPCTKYDVSLAVRAADVTPLGRDLSFVRGGHGMTYASSTTGFMIDLSWLNETRVLHNVTLDDTHVGHVISYEGGATWEQVYAVTNGSGWIAIGARDASVGVGGFSTGGGIGFLAGAYGYAVDRLRAMEVVTMAGDVVLATKTNQHSDLFWALQGGNGQFGIVTKFWQEAVPEPEHTEVGIWIIADSSLDLAYSNLETWFTCNKDPYSVVYYAVGYLPAQVVSGPLGVHTTIVGYHHSNPALNSSQLSFDAIFAPLILGLQLTYASQRKVRLAEAPALMKPYFPYGYRRGFWGSQTTGVTAAYVKQTSNRFRIYVNHLLARAESPYSATWVLQYMYPGLNGNLPAFNNDTAWPHALAGHQTLFSPAWKSSVHDAITYHTIAELDSLTSAHQIMLDQPLLAEYPNYMSPFSSGYSLFGENMKRLIDVKSKYDPWCKLHQGRVFATTACADGGWANMYP